MKEAGITTDKNENGKIESYKRDHVNVSSDFGIPVTSIMT